MGGPGQRQPRERRKAPERPDDAGEPLAETALVQAAWAAYRAKGTQLSRKFRRIAGKRGKRRAAVAVAHTLLVIIYHLLKEGTNYQEIAGDSEAA